MKVGKTGIERRFLDSIWERGKMYNGGTYYYIYYNKASSSFGLSFLWRFAYVEYGRCM